MAQGGASQLDELGHDEAQQTLAVALQAEAAAYADAQNGEVDDTAGGRWSATTTMTNCRLTAAGTATVKAP